MYYMAEVTATAGTWVPHGEAHTDVVFCEFNVERGGVCQIFSRWVIQDKMNLDSSC